MFNKWLEVFKLEFKHLMREPVTLFFMWVLPIIFTVVFGGAFGSELSTLGNGILGIDTVIPINIVFLLANVGLMGLPITIIELRNNKVLKRYVTYPLSYPLYFLALASALLFASFISTLIFGLLSFIKYDAVWRMNVLDTIIFIAIYLVTVFIFDVIGYMIALLIHNNRIANMTTTGLFLAMIFTSGIVLPIESLSNVVQFIAKIFPMYHLVQLFQYIWVGKFVWADQMWNVIYIVGLTTVLAMCLRVVKIKWD